MCEWRLTTRLTTHGGRTLYVKLDDMTKLTEWINAQTLKHWQEMTMYNWTELLNWLSIWSLYWKFVASQGGSGWLSLSVHTMTHWLTSLAAASDNNWTQGELISRWRQTIRRRRVIKLKSSGRYKWTRRFYCLLVCARMICISVLWLCSQFI